MNTFKSNLDYIFDLIRKTGKVIKSCYNSEQLEGAHKYVDNLERYLTHFERSPREEKFCTTQIAEFRKMLRIKGRAFNDIID